VRGSRTGGALGPVVTLACGVENVCFVVVVVGGGGDKRGGVQGVGASLCVWQCITAEGAWGAGGALGPVVTFASVCVCVWGGGEVGSVVI
jgi:hypothetical protein